MVYQVLKEELGECHVVETFGTRRMAETYIAGFKKDKQKALSIREVTIPADSPALHFPYLPGDPRCH